jgi:hypothetical protein
VTNFEDAVDPVSRLARDPGLRRTLEAARNWGVSPRRFLGWEPARVTTYDLDPVTGRVVRAVEIVEPEWDDDGRELAFALESYEADLCGGCRQPLAATTDPAAEDRLTPGTAIRCHRCTAIAQTAELYRNNPTPSALLFTVREHPPREDQGHADSVDSEGR